MPAGALAEVSPSKRNARGSASGDGGPAKKKAKGGKKKDSKKDSKKGGKSPKALGLFHAVAVGALNVYNKARTDYHVLISRHDSTNPSMVGKTVCVGQLCLKTVVDRIFRNSTDDRANA